MQFRDVVSLTATLTTIGQFCSGIFVCRKIIHHGNTNESSFFPLMVMFISSALWIKYGLLQTNSSLVFVNSVGAILGLVYVAAYYSHTFHPRHLHGQLCIGGLILLPPLIYVKYYAENQDDAVLYLGYSCATVSILSYGSPLSAINKVLKTRSTACMAFPMSLANFLASAQWFLYGYLLKDLFVQVPNAVGIVLGIVQLSLFWMFPQRNS